MRALVTGGCGFIGSALANRLVSEGYIVDIVDDLSNGTPDNLSCKFRTAITTLLNMCPHRAVEGQALLITGDFADPDILDRVKGGEYDTVYHLAANPRVAYSIEHPVETNETNVHKSIALFKVAAMSGTRVVFSSSSAIYGPTTGLPTAETCEKNPTSPYGLQKHMCEMYLSMFSELYGLDAISLRYMNVYGPKALGSSPYATAIAAWCQALHDGRKLRSDGDGEQTRDMIYIDDIVEANFLAGTSGGKFNAEAINIATGVSYSNNQILKMMTKEVGELDIVNAPARVGDVKHTLGDVTHAKNVIKFEAKFGLAEGLKKTMQWWNLI